MAANISFSICDIVCSALSCPISSFSNCTGHVGDVHVQPGSDHLRTRCGIQLQTLQHRHLNSAANRFEGAAVSDAIELRSGSLMFRQPKAVFARARRKQIKSGKKNQLARAVPVIVSPLISHRWAFCARAG